MYDPRIRVSQTYNHGSDQGYGYKNSFYSKERKLGKNDEGFGNWLGGDQEGVQFRPNHNPGSLGSDDDGVCSPPLWQSSPSPARSPSQPLLGHHRQRSLSQDSRIQTIVKGQKELMELVKNMPESSYELSLKDLVEHHDNLENQAQAQAQAPPPQEDRLGNCQRGGEKVKRGGSQNSDKNRRKSGSFESKGLFLKMGFPLSLQKRSNLGSNNSGKVSPKPPVIGEKDWWKMKFTGSSDSDSSRTSNSTSGSTNSSSSSSGSSSYGGSGRKKNGLFSSCWPSFHSRRSKYA